MLSSLRFSGTITRAEAGVKNIARPGRGLPPCRFQFLNLFGSALILANSFHFGALPSVVVNGVWILIAAYSLYRARRPR